MITSQIRLFTYSTYRIRTFSLFFFFSFVVFILDLNQFKLHIFHNIPKLRHPWAEKHEIHITWFQFYCIQIKSNFHWKWIGSDRIGSLFHYKFCYFYFFFFLNFWLNRKRFNQSISSQMHGIYNFHIIDALLPLPQTKSIITFCYSLKFRVIKPFI